MIVDPVENGGNDLKIGTPEKNPGKADERQRKQHEHKADRQIATVLKRRDLLPELMNNETYAVQTSPDNEQPAAPMPKSSQQHGNHKINIGVNALFYRFGKISEQKQEDGCKKKDQDEP